MARAYPVSSPDYQAASQPGDWQALRGELVALLDQVEGQYAQAGSGDPAFAGFAQRMRDLKYQVADVDPDDRHREALRSVKRQIERFNDRGEAEIVQRADDVLQTAIQQIRARTQGAPAMAQESRWAQPAPVLAQPVAAAPIDNPRFEELAHSMAGLSGRLGELEGDLKLQRGNASQVKEIADQVSQLSQVVELLAGAVGETGQVKRLEGQIAGLAQLIGQAPKPDLTMLTERLDQLSATVDRLADLQVQQIQHVVREAEFGPQKEAESAKGMQAIEAGVRSIYDRLDALESSLAVPPAHLERISAAMGEITSRLGSDAVRPERLLGLVDALNGRINEIEDRGESLDGLKGDIEGLRTAMLGALEPRFAAIETQIGQLDERLQHRGDAPGVAQLEAQIRQLVARMDQTGEQLTGLARLYGDERSAAPDFEALAELAATRTAAAMARNLPPVPAEPDFDRLADLVAARTVEAVAKLQPPPPPDFQDLADKAATKASAMARNAPASGRMLSEAGLAEFEARITRLVDGLARTRPPEGVTGVADGIGRVEQRLASLEAALTRRPPAPPEPPPAPTPPVVPAASTSIPPALPVAAAPVPVDPVPDAMPRNPSAEAPLKEFGFPDLGPVRAALEAKNGPRKAHPGVARAGDEIEPRLEIQPITPEMAGGGHRPKQSLPGTAVPPPDFDPTRIARPPRPESSLDAGIELPSEPAAPPVAPAPAAPEVPASSRNTFIEAARRAAQRQNQPKTAQADVNSLIGRAFSRFQGSDGPAEKVAKSTAKPAMAEPVVPEPAAPSVKPARAKTARTSLLSRKTKPQAAAKPAKPVAETTSMPAPDAPKESFLVRNRRPILLTASLVAVSFMALNLVMQRMAAHDDPAPAASSGPLKPVVPDATAPAPAPNAGSSAPTAKPVSEIAPVVAPAEAPVADARPAPRVIAMTDPVTTASIDPGEAMSFTPSSTDASMPPALAPTTTPTPATANFTVPLAPAADAGATASTPAIPDAGAPATLDSPVKVELPPDSLGPLELRQAAADGDARAQFEIAAIYSEGRAVPQDFKQAAVWYERAAAQGFGPAQYRLGNLYENGKGVAKDYEQARLWYQRAAEAGNRMAMHNLAALYAGGQFGKQDFASAAEWFERAANLGMKDSQFNLGMLYARGLGVTQSIETSYKWFALAASDNDKDAAKARDDVARSLDAAAVKRLEGEVAAWKPAQIDLAANFAPIGTWEKDFNPGATITDKGVVTKVQAALQRLGFDVGTRNGRIGPKTTAAIKAFEQSTGMTQVGAINPRLLAVLGSQPV